MKGLIGKKIFVNQVFITNGKVVPITIIEVLPNIVSQVKTKEKDGYSALQLAAGFKKEKNLSKPLIKHLAKVGVKEKKVLCEFSDMSDYKLGDKVLLSLFQSGDFVNIQATSKGKGTAGVIKRHNFSRGPMTHGSKHHRAPGSTGLSRPDKVWKGQPMPGRKGNEKVTIKNLLVVKADLPNNLLIVKGTFAGSLGSFCKILLNSQKSKVNALDLVIYTSQPQQEVAKTQKTLTTQINSVNQEHLDKLENNSTSLSEQKN